MAQTYKVLGQVDPLAATLTAAYTVPAATTAVLSNIVVANRAAIGKTFRVSIAVAGAVDSVEQYIAYDVAIGANEVEKLGQRVTLGATDVVRVFASTQDLSFSIFGVENS